MLRLLKYVAASDHSFNVAYGSPDDVKIDPKSELHRLKTLMSEMCSEEIEDEDLISLNVKEIGKVEKSNDLGDELVLDCTENIYACSILKDNDQGDLCIRESLHPLWPISTYSGDIVIKDTGAIRVEFDYQWTDRHWGARQLNCRFTLINHLDQFYINSTNPILRSLLLQKAVNYTSSFPANT